MAIKAKLEGISAFKKQLSSYGKEVEKAAKLGIEKGANDIAMDAKSRCRAQSIATEIQVRKTDEGADITTQSPISAYLEFGTGNFAKATLTSYPDDWKELASKFFISGLGRMPSFPYLYPAFQQGKQDLILDTAINIEAI